MAELADALDSGSSRYCTGGGSSPLARMETIQKWIVFFCFYTYTQKAPYHEDTELSFYADLICSSCLQHNLRR